MDKSNKQMIHFPSNFMWGTATASYQIEGGVNDDNRGWTIWDAFSHTNGRIINNDTGDKAVDHYHLYPKDIELMKNMGLRYYRFSIAWSRIIPDGTGDINKKGIDFYNSLINALIKANIEPIVTLYHWDLPLPLQTENNGWLSGKYIINAYNKYADTCFNHFGDRVKYWITFNEPWCSSILGHCSGEHAPGRKCKPGIEPYIASHNMLISHAYAVDTYRKKYQEKQNGKIGITLNCDWREPKPDKNNDKYNNNKDAAERSLLFNLGWFADPIYFGDYPSIMRERVGTRLPTFTEEEKKLLINSNDFFGLNHYGSAYAEPMDGYTNGLTNGENFWIDEGIKCSNDDKWLKTDMGWNVVPFGIRKMTEWIHNRYHPKGGIIITENGCAVTGEDDKLIAEKDDFRINFFRDYLYELNKGMKENGIDVKGYFAWSFIDNFEWAFGYSKRFGMHWVDYKTMERVPKKSAKWFTQVIKQNGFEY